MNEEIDYADDFIVILTIDGSPYEEVEVKITDINKTIREQIASIVSVFGLPEFDNGGNPIRYLLGQVMDEGEEPVILEFEDECGREHCLVDYNIQPFAHLCLLNMPLGCFPHTVLCEMKIPSYSRTDINISVMIGNLMKFWGWRKIHVHSTWSNSSMTFIDSDGSIGFAFLINKHEYSKRIGATLWDGDKMGMDQYYGIFRKLTDYWTYNSQREFLLIVAFPHDAFRITLLDRIKNIIQKFIQL